ncbi:hypothetical protein JCM3766R1_005569 [Sporobolomyces carnicolor]
MAPVANPPFSLAGASDFRHQLQVANRYTIVWLTILLYEHLSTFDDELRHIWKADWTLFQILFLFNRYGSLVIVTIASVLTLAEIPSSVCEKIAWILPFSGVFVVLVCDAIMSLRIHALYDKSRTISLLLAVSVIVEACVMIAVSTRLEEALVLPPIARAVFRFEGCAIRAKDAEEAGLINSLFWSAPLVVATMFLGLTLYRTVRASRGTARMPLYERFLVGQLKWFVIIAMTHLANVILISQRGQPTIQTMNVTASIVLTSVCTSRLVLGFYGSGDEPRSTGTVTTLSTLGKNRGGDLILLEDRHA